MTLTLPASYSRLARSSRPARNGDGVPARIDLGAEDQGDRCGGHVSLGVDVAASGAADEHHRAHHADRRRQAHAGQHEQRTPEQALSSGWSEQAAARPQGRRGHCARSGTAGHDLGQNGRRARGRYGLAVLPAAEPGSRRPGADPLGVSRPDPGDDRSGRGRRTRGRLARQAPALPLRQRLHPAHPLPDGGHLADLSAGPSLDRWAGLPDPGRPRHGGGRRGRLPAAGGRASPHRRGGYRRRTPGTRPPRSGLGSGRGAAPDHVRSRSGPSARPCWTSATWPASARSTAPSCSSCRACTPVRRWRSLANLARLVLRGRQLLLANRWRTEQTTTGDLRRGGGPTSSSGRSSRADAAVRRSRPRSSARCGQERRSYWCPRCQPACASSTWSGWSPMRLPRVAGVDRGHVLSAQLEVEDREVLRDPGRGGRLRE